MQYFIPMLTILFIGLKLTALITWPWYLVLSPLYIGFTILVLFLLIAAVVMNK
jgi:hypothetical protein